jgi:hypothetical protein
MAMSRALGDREHDKFVETTAGDTAVRTKAVDRPETYDSEGKLTVTDNILLSLMNDIKNELKVMNIHLAEISCLEFENGDVEP